MPMKRELYPKNWRTIALIIKTLFADWHCEECDRPCRRPGEDWFEFAFGLERIGSDWGEQTFEEARDGFGYKEYPGRFVLTVAHLDQDPGSNDRENLKALCPACHFRHDALHNAKKAAKTRFANKHKGQLDLF